MRNTWYGGFYHTPDFQVNARMEHAFGGRAVALSVQAFYVNALKACDAKEVAYQQKAKNNLLTQKDLIAREKNTKFKHQLILEWYDIHHNGKLGIDLLPEMVKHTLQHEMNRDRLLGAEEKLLTMLKDTRALTTALKDSFEHHQMPAEPFQEKASVIEVGYQPKLQFFKSSFDSDVKSIDALLHALPGCAA